MPKKRGFLKAYLFLIIVVGLLGITDASATYFQYRNSIYETIIVAFSIIFFFFNLLAVTLFYHYRVERIAYVLPIYHLLAFVLFNVAGYLMIVRDWLSPAVVNGTMAVGLASSLFEIAFAAYVVKKLTLI